MGHPLDDLFSIQNIEYTRSLTGLPLVSCNVMFRHSLQACASIERGHRCTLYLQVFNPKNDTSLSTALLD